jgi:hypothetical protein
MVYGVYTMKRKQIYLDEGQERAIKRLATRRSVSEALVIREAMAKYLVDQESGDAEDLPVEEDPLLGIIGIGKHGVTDGSVNHDSDLYDAPRKVR